MPSRRIEPRHPSSSFPFLLLRAVLTSTRWDHLPGRAKPCAARVCFSRCHKGLSALVRVPFLQRNSLNWDPHSTFQVTYFMPFPLECVHRVPRAHSLCSLLTRGPSAIRFGFPADAAGEHPSRFRPRWHRWGKRSSRGGNSNPVRGGDGNILRLKYLLSASH